MIRNRELAQQYRPSRRAERPLYSIERQQLTAPGASCAIARWFAPLAGAAGAPIANAPHFRRHLTLENPTLDPRRSALVLQEIQPGLLGLMDGSVSTLAPIFAAAGLTGRPLSAFFVGLAASLGAAISMGLSEALSDDGSLTGRGGPQRRGMITGVATGLGGMLHTFPFLIPDLGVALKLAYAVVVCELIAIAFIRYRFMGGKLANTIVQVLVGGGIVFAIGVWLGRIGAG